jgi:hypothetical protein
MLMNPAVMALNGVSLTVTLMMLMAAGFAVQVVRHWDITSGSERQLELERRTYLTSTLVTWCFSASVVALLLFVYNAEQMAPQFVGAMCATGVLNAHPLGWPTLFLKILVFFAGAAWLMLNRLDNQAADYPLVRVKYWMLLGLLPLVALEAGRRMAGDEADTNGKRFNTGQLSDAEFARRICADKVRWLVASARSHFEPSRLEADPLWSGLFQKHREFTDAQLLHRRGFPITLYRLKDGATLPDGTPCTGGATVTP